MPIYSRSEGEYVAFGDFIAMCDKDEQLWRVSKISNLTHNSLTLTTIGEFGLKEDAIAAMRRNGLHVVKAAHVV